MTARTWLGGRSNNQVSNPKNWSPTGKPGAGDTLTVTHGTVNIFGDQLPAGDTLRVANANVNIHHGTDDHLAVSGISRINLTDSTGVTITTVPTLGPATNQITINAFGNNGLNVATTTRWSGPEITVNNHGTLTGGFGGWAAGRLTINGGDFANTNTAAGYDAHSVIINANVIGTGNFTVGSFHAPGVSHALEFIGSVGDGQTVTMETGAGFSVVEIDHPETFNAAIKWGADKGVIDLDGLIADSYTKDAIRGDLTFYSGASAVKSLRFTENSPAFAGPVAVSQGTSEGAVGIEIRSTTFNSPHTGADLPLHV